MHYEVVYFITNRYKVGCAYYYYELFHFQGLRAFFFGESIYTCILIEFKCFYQQKLSGIIRCAFIIYFVTYRS